MLYARSARASARSSWSRTTRSSTRPIWRAWTSRRWDASSRTRTPTSILARTRRRRPRRRTTRRSPIRRAARSSTSRALQRRHPAGGSASTSRWWSRPPPRTVAVTPAARDRVRLAGQLGAVADAARARGASARPRRSTAQQGAGVQPRLRPQGARAMSTGSTPRPRGVASTASASTTTSCDRPHEPLRRGRLSAQTPIVSGDAIAAMRERVLADLDSTGIVNGQRLVAAHHVVLDPAYVHITQVVRRRRHRAEGKLLAARGVHSHRSLRLVDLLLHRGQHRRSPTAGRALQPLIVRAQEVSPSSSTWGYDSATAAVDAAPRPVDGQPLCDSVGEWHVETGSVRPHPGLRP